MMRPLMLVVHTHIAAAATIATQLIFVKMASAAPSTLIVPHPELTPIVKLDATNLVTLQEELCPSACSVPSVLSGSANGHLTLVMPAVDCQQRGLLG